jgi:endo-1,4-beta-mannosidase
MIPFYSRGAANLILDPNPHPSCVDYWDIHFYNNEGSIPNCEKIAQVARSYGKKIYLGEFGQLSKSYSDELQVKTVTNFIRNAKACGFSGALAWRLADIRAGNNPEARLSFEAFGKMRPAYDVIRNWNHSAQGR